MSLCGVFDFTPSELGTKGMVFLVLCVLLIAGNICILTVNNTAVVYAVICGVLGLLISVVGIAATGLRHENALLAFIAVCGLCVLLDLILVMVLFFTAYFFPAGYIGCGAQIFLGIPACWLAHDGRGKTFAIAS